MSSGFISEAEIAAAKQKRQDEWEKVRQPDEPLELPEEPHDSRSLYERLKVQKDQKDMEFEESRKLKNLIRGLVEDEVDFLETIDKSQLMAKKKQEQEEHSELQDYRKKVAELKEKSQLAMPSILTGTITNTNSSSNSTSIKSSTILQGSTGKRLNQKSILAGVIKKRKCEDGPTTTTKLGSMKVISEVNGAVGIDSLTETSDKHQLPSKESSKNESINDEQQQASINLNNTTTIQNPTKRPPIPPTGLYCIGILPSYCRSQTTSSRSTSQDSSDDSDDSTDIEDVPMSMPIQSAAHDDDDDKCEKTKPKYFFS